MCRAKFCLVGQSFGESGSIISKRLSSEEDSKFLVEM